MTCRKAVYVYARLSAVRLTYVSQVLEGAAVEEMIHFP
jgi:hypothetical protein